MKRRLMALVLVGACLAAWVGSAAAQDKPAEKKKDKTATAVIAHIKMSGSLPEASSGAPDLFGGGGSSETLKARLDRIQKAKTDANVQALYLQFENLGVTWGKVNELRAAIQDFRKSGKKAYAYAETYDLPSYLVATACDHVSTPPGGGVEIAGVRFELGFYKDLFDKVHLKFDAIRMGDFKGAVEPYTRNSISPENRKQWDELVDDFYALLVDAIATSRPGMTAEKVKEIIDQGPFTAKQALQLGLIDAVEYPDAVQAHIKAEAKNDQLALSKDYGKKKSEEIDFSNPFAIFKLLAPPKEAKMSAKPKIAVIYAEGAIESGKGGPGFMGGNSIGSTTMVEAIRKAKEEPSVKAIVLRVDSPGGSALASDLIWHELNTSKKPVVASMGDVAASGGYYISMAADKIFAEPGTITGSIGVFGGKFVIGGVEQWAGINTEVIARGKNSGVTSMTHPWTESERLALTRVIEDVYDQFLTKAVQGRKKAGKDMTLEQLRKLAGGRIWSGRQAKANGLIDEIGTLDDAIAAAKKLANLGEKDDVELYNLPKARSFIDSLMDSSLDSRLRVAGLEPLMAHPALRRHLQVLQPLLANPRERVWVLMPYVIESK
jgi:protease-4